MTEQFPMTLAEMQTEIARLIRLNVPDGESQSLTLERMIHNVLMDMRRGRVLSAGAGLAVAQEYADHYFGVSA